MDGQTLEILPEEVEVRALARSGFEVASEGAYLAALVTDLTPELVQEGLAREVVRRVQDLRKQADLDIADRIRLYYQATPALAAAIENYREYVMGETLTVELLAKPAPQGLAAAEAAFGEETIQVALEKAS
jgi:isoleucyl-tRNA synthetase